MTKPVDPTGNDHPLIEASEKGYLGTVPDPTPNEAYTFAGQARGAKTPETVEPGSEGSTKLAVPETVEPRKV